VASEIFALTEKTGPAGDDLVIIEDSADSYSKKKAKRENMGGARAPAKLEDDLDCIMLYTFDGVLTDAIAGGQELSNTVGGIQLYSTGIVSEARGLWLDDSLGVNGTAATIGSSKVPSGDFTAQVVFFPGKAFPESGIVDSNLFWMYNDTDSKWVFWVGFPDSGDQMEPGCNYADTAGTEHQMIVDNLVIGDGMPAHLVFRLFDAGGGSYTQEFWVNNTLIESNTGLLGPYAFSASDNYIVGVGKGGANTGACRMVVESCKLSDRKLTDTEIGDEFRKAMGYPAI
jgi:hypothetical protein